MTALAPSPRRPDPLERWILADFEAVERRTAPPPEETWDSVEGFIDSAVAWLSRRDLAGEILGEIGRRLAVGRDMDAEGETAADAGAALADDEAGHDDPEHDDPGHDHPGAPGGRADPRR